MVSRFSWYSCVEYRKGELLIGLFVYTSERSSHIIKDGAQNGSGVSLEDPSGKDRAEMEIIKGKTDKNIYKSCHTLFG